jgi:hypothetical protein
VNGNGAYRAALPAYYGFAVSGGLSATASAPQSAFALGASMGIAAITSAIDADFAATD